MNKHLKLFANHTAYEAVKNNIDKPNVVMCQQENEVHFNPAPHDYSTDYFTIESLEDGNTLYFGSRNTNPSNFGSTIFYSLDNGSTWQQYLAPKYCPQNTPISLDANQKILFKTLNSVKHYDRFLCSKTFKVYGNSMSLIYGDQFIGQTNLNGIDYIFRGLFFGCGNLLDASNLVLPATTLTQGCYYDMFNNCASITRAPELPATRLIDYCYCQMFKGCTNLNYIKMMATYIPLISGCTMDWVEGVAANGIFVKNASADQSTTRDIGIPTGWTVQTANQ